MVGARVLLPHQDSPHLCGLAIQGVAAMGEICWVGTWRSPRGGESERKEEGKEAWPVGDDMSVTTVDI